MILLTQLPVEVARVVVRAIHMHFDHKTFDPRLFSGSIQSFIRNARPSGPKLIRKRLFFTKLRCLVCKFSLSPKCVFRRCTFARVFKCWDVRESVDGIRSILTSSGHGDGLQNWYAINSAQVKAYSADFALCMRENVRLKPQHANYCVNG